MWCWCLSFQASWLACSLMYIHYIEFLTILPEAHLWGHTDVGREGLALSLRSNLFQTCSIGLRSGLCAGQSSSSTPNSSIHVFMDLALCTGAHSCWNRKGRSPNCSHKVGSMELSNISWYAEAFRVPFTGTKGPSPAPEKQPHTIIPLHQTLHLVPFSWKPPNPDSSIRLPDGRERFITPEKASPLL